MSYSVIERGCRNTLEYRMFITGPDGAVASPFHDIPLFKDKNVLNMVVEIPRWSNAKMEICKEEAMNPIKQDVKKGKLRFVKNLFPHHGYIWNYGAFPQTWEDPTHLDPDTDAKGDCDPLDVCEIGDKIHERGAVVQVKVLGIMALIDEGETDWKVLVIDVTDPLAEKLNDIDDVEKFKPGFVKATYEWFRDYKVPDGKPKNQFAFNGEAKNKAFAVKVIEQTHQQWRRLICKSTDCGDINCMNCSVSDSPYKVSTSETKAVVEKTAAPGAASSLPADVDKWYYA